MRPLAHDGNFCDWQTFVSRGLCRCWPPCEQTEFLQQRRRRRNRSIEIQSAICRDKSAYTDNPATSGTFAGQEVPTSGPAAQCSRLAADNRLVAGSSPPEPTTHSRARGDFITAWLEVRVLSGPPRSLTRTEIFRLSTNSPAIGGLPYMPLVFELRFIGFEVAVLAVCLCRAKSRFLEFEISSAHGHLIMHEWRI